MILTGRREHRVLDTMHCSLRETDPRLVARFTMFTRMNRDKALPTVERVRLRWLRWMPALLRAVTRHWRRSRLRSAVLIPVAAAAMLAVILLVMAGQSQASCTPARAAARGGQVVTGRQYPVAPACPQSPGRLTGK
jgi:hypothetical protein